MNTRTTSWFIILAAILTAISAIVHPSVLTVVAGAITVIACVVSMIATRKEAQ